MSTKQVIVMRTDLNMRKGKLASQTGHAASEILFNEEFESGTFYDIKSEQTEDWVKIRVTDDMAQWMLTGKKKIVVGCTDEKELLSLYEQAQKAGLLCVLITDAGHTEFHGEPTNTCIAIGPAKEEEIDKITGNLKLL